MTNELVSVFHIISSHLAAVESVQLTVGTKTLLTFGIFAVTQFVMMYRWGSKLTLAVADIATKAKAFEDVQTERYNSIRDDLDDHEDRLRSIERRP